ncbi:MAG: glycosyltransferase [Actinobacteria bacterium]|nr:glycosyltransferase [Actinomycetota bacterium]MCL5446375.1 glycosyltransferase [Actinomycetota bacterium]
MTDRAGGQHAGFRRRYFALVAGGGTAGHAKPALELARELARRHPPDCVALVGGRRGLERKVWEPSGMEAFYLPGRGMPRISRTASWTGIWGYISEMVVFSAELAMAMAGSAVLVARKRPAVVVVFGGYSAVAPALAAVAMRIPLVVANVDAVAGRSNQILARLAKASGVAWPGTGLPREVVTGAPVSRSIVEAGRSRRSAGASAESDAARRELGIPEGRFVVLAVGGSLGARRLNELVLDIASAWSSRADVAIYHIVGDRYLAWAQTRAMELGLPGTGDDHADGGTGIAYVQVGYESRMDRAYLAADLAICRSGAITVSELAAAILPAVLVPLPGAPSAHQEVNARVLASRDAAVMVSEDGLSVEKLRYELERLMGDEARLDGMAAKLSSLFSENATLRLADLVEKYARAS